MGSHGGSNDAISSKRRALLGHVIISLCDWSFALHNRLASKLTGRSIETISTKEIQEQQICQIHFRRTESTDEDILILTI